jgi:hypothetical protein
MHASRKRLLLAAYIDFLFFSSFVYVLSFLLGTLTSSALVEIAIGIGASTVAYFVAWMSIGRAFLSISPNGLVPEKLKRRETYLTMFLATLFVLDGTKQIVRWTQFSAWPFFGFIPEGATYVILSLLSGSLFVVAGNWLYKLDVRGLFVAVALVVVQLFSFLASTSLLNDIIAKRAIERREIQGMPVRDGEVEFLQSMMVPAVIVFAGIILIALILQRKRFDQGAP